MQILDNQVNNFSVRNKACDIAKWVLPTIALTGVVSGCSLSSQASTTTTSRPAVELTETVRADIASLYDCAWYYHLTEQKDLGNVLLDEAVEVSKSAGVEGQDIMGLYATARQAQKEATLPLAISIAKQKKQQSGVKLIDSNQDGAVQPSNDDMSEAHIQTYQAKCIPMGEKFKS